MKKISTLVGIIIIIIAAVILVSGVFIYQYFVTKINNQTQQQNISEGCKIQPYEGSSKYVLTGGELDIRGGAICSFLINPNLPVYTFHLIGNPDDNSVDKIEISKGDGSVFQTIDLTAPADIFSGDDNSIEHYAYANGVPVLSTQDVNFDGYKDIELPYNLGAGDSGYFYWIFNPETGTFIYNQELSALINPIIHQNTKTITSLSADDPMDYSKSTYEFDENGKLILIHEESQEFLGSDKNGNESCQETIDDLVNGKMVTNTKVADCNSL